MEADKVRQVINIYRKKFEELGIRKENYPHDELLDSAEHGLQHCRGMLDRMEDFIRQGRMDKVFRWLGFIQGFLWSQKIYTLTQLTNHNRKDLR